MRDRHAEVAGSKVRIEFKGKSGIDHEIDIRDPRIARIVGQCQDLPGQELFQYVDDQGPVHDVGSADVNEYLREISGQDFTAKDFRTWAGTALAAQALQEFEDFDTKAAAKRNITTSRSNAWQSGWAIPRRSAASATFIPRSSTPTWIVRWSQPLKERTETELRESLSRCRRKRRPCWLCSSNGWSGRCGPVQSVAGLKNAARVPVLGRAPTAAVRARPLNDEPDARPAKSCGRPDLAHIMVGLTLDEIRTIIDPRPAAINIESKSGTRRSKYLWSRFASEMPKTSNRP